MNDLKNNHNIFDNHSSFSKVYILFLSVCLYSSNQWRNVISGGPRFKIFEGPLVEVLKARVEHRICTSFLGGPAHVHPENF